MASVVTEGQLFSYSLGKLISQRMRHAAYPAGPHPAVKPLVTSHEVTRWRGRAKSASGG